MEVSAYIHRVMKTQPIGAGWIDVQLEMSSVHKTMNRLLDIDDNKRSYTHNFFIHSVSVAGLEKHVKLETKKIYVRMKLFTRGNESA